MIPILTDIIYQALAKGYERQHLRIQFSESLKNHLIDTSQMVIIKKEDEEKRRSIDRQFMGIRTEVHPGIMGLGFMLWCDHINLNNSIRPNYPELLGVYSNMLGLPTK